MAIKFLEHTADIKFQATAETLEQAFAESAMALKQSIAEDIKVKPAQEKTINIKGKDTENLLYNFLEEFIFLLDSENFLLSEIKQIKINNLELTATISGDSTENYKFTNSVKAITYNQMFIKQEKNKFTIQVVLDV